MNRYGVNTYSSSRTSVDNNKNKIEVNVNYSTEEEYSEEIEEKNNCILYNNLHDTYMQYPESEKCYLDGRYFNAVFNGYPGLCKEPLHFRISKINDEYINDIWMHRCTIENINSILLIRVIVDMDDILHHSSLLIIEPPVRGVRRACLFNTSHSSNSKWTELLASEVFNYLSPSIPNMAIYPYHLQVEQLPSSCQVSGWCNAFIIAYAVAALTGKSYDPANIRRYASMIERHYPLCPHTEPEVQYGDQDALAGAAVGGIAGGLLTRSVGGFALGALGGYAIGSLL